DMEFFSPERARPAQDGAPPMIFMPALVKPAKGHFDLLRAASILAAKNFDFRICCAGAVEDKSLLQDLLKYVASNGLAQKVAFLGEISQEQIRDYYALSSVVVLPSHHPEAAGRVLVEAQAMKKPVIAYESGGLPESFVPNETGFLVK